MQEEEEKDWEEERSSQIRDGCWKKGECRRMEHGGE